MVIADRCRCLPIRFSRSRTSTKPASSGWRHRLCVQIYCDFSGYSDLALGTARLLGYRLTINFNMPYASVNMTNSGGAGYMSLSSWIRDYPVFPAGNRGSTCERLST